MGMTIDESIKGVEKRILPIYDNDADHEALVTAIDTMRKYQQIQEIVKEWREVGLDYDSCDAMDNIERVIENGSDKRL